MDNNKEFLNNFINHAVFAEGIGAIDPCITYAGAKKKPRKNSTQRA